VGKYLHRPLRNWRGVEVAERRLAPSFPGRG